MSDTLPQEKQVKKTTTKQKKDGFTIPVYKKSGEKREDISIPSPELKDSYQTILQRYIHVFLTNQRKGTAHTKTRSEVVGTTKKIYRQKGTGRARHGSEKAPIFVGGGVVGGPRKKFFHSSFTKKQKRIALITSICEKLKEGKIVCFEKETNQIDIKTKNATVFLKKLKLQDAKTLLIRPEEQKSNLCYAMRNIPTLTITPFQSINPYILLTNDALLMSEEYIPQLQTILTTES